MNKIGNNIHQIGGRNNGQQKTQNTSSTTGGWRTPWWVFRLIKFLHNINPMIARIFGLILDATVWLFSFLLFSFLWAIIHTTFKSLAHILSNKKLIMGCLITWGALHLFNKTSLDVDIPLYAIIGPPVTAIIGLIILVIWRSSWKISLPKTEGFGKFRKDMWDNGRLLPILTCVSLIHLAIYKIAPNFWWNNICNWWSFGLQVALVLAMSIKPENPKKPTKHKLSTLAAVLLGLTFLLHITIGDVNVEEKLKQLSNTAQATTRTSTPRLAPSISMGTPACFKEELGPDKDAAYRAFPGQMDLLAVFCRESRFYHLENDKPKVRRNDNGSTDTGIAQINSAHDAELTKLNLDKNKLEDNLKYARILYDKRGLIDWTPRLAHNKTFVFRVPVEPGDTGSNTFKLPYQDLKEFLWVPDRPAWLIVRGADGTEHQVEFYPLSEKNKFVDLDPVVKPIKEYKFKSKDDKKVLVTVTYQY